MSENEADKILDNLFSGNGSVLFGIIESALHRLDGNDFHPHHGLTEAGFKAMVAAQIQTLILLSNEHKNIVFKSEKKLIKSLKVEGFMDLFVANPEKKLVVIIEFKYVRLGYLRYAKTKKNLVSGRFDNRRSLEDAALILKTAIFSDFEYRDPVTGNYLKLDKLVSDAKTQARGYRDSLEKLESMKGIEIKEIGLVGFGNRLLLSA